MNRNTVLAVVAVAIVTSVLFIWRNAKIPVKPGVNQSITIQQAASFLERHGAVIEFRNGHPVALNTRTKDVDRPTLRATLENIALIGHLLPLERLDLGGTELNDKALELLQPLLNLRYFNVADTSVTAAGCKVLASFPNLEQLDVGGDRIGEKGIQHLRQCQNLTHLDICGTDATNNALAHIGQLHKLRWLAICFNKGITDEGLKELARLDLYTLRADETSIRGHVFDQLACRKTLSHLDATYTKIDDIGAEALSSYEQLVYLELAYTKVTDVGVEALQKIKTLRGLVLLGTKITDASVPALLSFPKLMLLGVLDTKISDEGLAELQRSKPGIAVGYVGFKSTLDKDTQNRP